CSVTPLIYTRLLINTSLAELLGSRIALLAAEQLSAAAPPAAAAVGPRHLDPDSKAAVAAALSKIVTKQKGTPAEGKLSNADLVALAGAHAVAVCGGPVMDVPVGRVDAAGPDPGGKGFGDPVTFDNAYYTALLAKPWLKPNDSMAAMIVCSGLPSDHALPDDPECLKFIQAYADDQQLFFRDFAAAYMQLTSLGAAWA
ncbi:heme peroxidase, partial [Scenedesmus sp. NREL 46B-D3]